MDLILATCFPLYYIVMRAERPILLRFLNVLTSLNDFILFFVKYIASGTLIHYTFDKIKCLKSTT